MPVARLSRAAAQASRKGWLRNKASIRLHLLRAATRGFSVTHPRAVSVKSAEVGVIRAECRSNADDADNVTGSDSIGAQDLWH